MEDPSVPVLETQRLRLLRMAEEDAPFLLGLLNEPSFLRFIGDRGVRTEDDARAYVRNGPLASYRQHGFGLYTVTLKATAAPIGICGLLRRETLPAPDVGFAFLPAYWSQGYAYESARAVLDHGRDALGVTRVLAVTTVDNAASIRLLEKLGLRYARMVRLSNDAPALRLFSTEVEAP